MNYKRMLVAGLVAGVIVNASEFLLNGVVLAQAMQGDLTRHNLVFAPWAMTYYVIMAFIIGLGLAWLYASIRPRYGPGFGTALIAAAAFWTGVYVLPTIGMLAIGMGDATSYLLSLAWGAGEVVVAAGVAGYIYRESAVGAAEAAPAS